MVEGTARAVGDGGSRPLSTRYATLPKDKLGDFLVAANKQPRFTLSV